MTASERTILFLCTGNYYRSRFAEEYFNALAQEKGLPWKATSRALAIERGFANVGPMSPHALMELERRIKCPQQPHRNPKQCSMEDLEAANLIVALKEKEHRPLLIERYPPWADRVQYWNVHDIDQAHPDVALSEVSDHVEELIKKLSQSHEAGQTSTHHW